MPAREFNLKAYAAEPRLADHHSQAACTATLPTAPRLLPVYLHFRPIFFSVTEGMDTLWHTCTQFCPKFVPFTVPKVHTRPWRCFRGWLAEKLLPTEPPGQAVEWNIKMLTQSLIDHMDLVSTFV